MTHDKANKKFKMFVTLPSDYTFWDPDNWNKEHKVMTVLYADLEEKYLTASPTATFAPGGVQQQQQVTHVSPTAKQSQAPVSGRMGRGRWPLGGETRESTQATLTRYKDR